ncbi:ABC transporter ATP-binding protein [Kitasatospora sp. NPDC092948]|uniref:ABC transporter ATP-binding protein n=1 Tax=Kitasatospora sp. NPDC092948 TaxID=3364088 RepID=UPI0037F96790
MTALAPAPALTPAPAPAREVPTPWRLLARHLRPQAARLGAGAALTVLGGLAGLVQPMAARSVIESLTAGRSVAAPAAALAGLVLTGALLTGVGDYQLQCTAESVVRRARARLAARILRLPVAEFEQLSHGDLISRLTSDSSLLRVATGQALVGSATSVLMVLGGLAAMLVLDPALCGTALGVMALVGAVAALTLPRIMRTAKQGQALVGELGSVLDRALGAFRTVKANGMEEQLTAEAVTAADRAWHSGVRNAGLLAVADAAAQLAVQLAFLAVLGVGGARVATGQLPLSGLIAFLFYLIFIAPQIPQLISNAGVLQRGLAAAQRMAEIEALPVEPTGPAPAPSATAPAALALHDVSFRYPGRAAGALHGIGLDLPPGGLTALVGPSGAGKSTVFALLERFYEPTGGRITLDGRDLRDWPLAELRGAIGYVEQDTPVLAGTLRENLLAAAPHATGPELHRALAVTRLDDAAGLPDGLDTQLGQRGAALSGGQRQRVAIARALLRRPRLLLLDEATSHLDAVNEHALREVVAEVARTTTVLVIAHRLSTVTEADRILVLDGGRIRATGTHPSLLATDALYAELARTQLLPGT